MELIETRIERKVQEIESKQARLDRESVQTERKIKTFSGFAWFFVILGGIVGIFGLFLFSIRFPATPNELGDFYSGTVGSLWSLAGLFFIYVAFLGQKKQLSLQQIELMNSQLEVMYTQSELKGQKEAMKAQNELLTQQKFESTFFKLMENHIGITTNIEVNKYCHKLNIQIRGTGKDSFKSMIQALTENISQKNYPEDQLNFLRAATNKYYSLFDCTSEHLSVYFRNLYNIIKFIDESAISDKKRYANFIRAQLSPAEIELLTYNGLISYGEEKFKPLIVKYSLLKHCQNNDLRSACINSGFYPKKAFA